MAVVQQTLAVGQPARGQSGEARDLLPATLDYVASSSDTEFLANALELSACDRADLGDMPQAARLAGAAEAIRQRAGHSATAARRRPA